MRALACSQFISDLHAGVPSEDCAFNGQSLKVNPDNALTCWNLEVVYGCLNRYNEEIEAYRQVLRIDPVDFNAWYWLGCAYGRYTH